MLTGHVAPSAVDSSPADKIPLILLHFPHGEWNAMDPWEKMAYTDAAAGQIRVDELCITLEFERDEYFSFMTEIIVAGRKCPSFNCGTTKVGA